MDEQKILAAIENFGTVSVCPGGVVHISLPHFTLKFMPADFLKFCELIAKSRVQFDAPKNSGNKPRLTVVPTEKDPDQPPSPE